MGLGKAWECVGVMSTVYGEGGAVCCSVPSVNGQKGKQKGRGAVVKRREPVRWVTGRSTKVQSKKNQVNPRPVRVRGSAYVNQPNQGRRRTCAYPYWGRRSR